MRFANRDSIDAPKVLTDPQGKGAKELEKVKAHRNDPEKNEKSFTYKMYKDPEVKKGLEQLFHGKCAYCETLYNTQAPVDVEHYRPKNAVEGAGDHPGYWWLAMVWSNLLPSCIDCNRRRRQETPEPESLLGRQNELATRLVNTGKKDAFPIAGTRANGEGESLTQEEAYLIDPTRDDPDDFLEFHLDPDLLIGLILPRRENGAEAVLPALDDIENAAETTGVSLRGAVSIQVYGLNRLGLVQERTRVLRQLEFMRQMIIEIDQIARELEASSEAEIKDAARQLDRLIERILREINKMSKPEAPYSALVTHWKRKFIAALV